MLWKEIKSFLTVCQTQNTKKDLVKTYLYTILELTFAENLRIIELGKKKRQGIALINKIRN